MKEYKNRNLDKSLKVDFYRCLNRKGFTFSIRQNGKVVAHTDKIILKECELIVNKSAKNQCIKLIVEMCTLLLEVL